MRTVPIEHPVVVSFDVLLRRPNDQLAFKTKAGGKLKDAIAGGEFSISVNGVEHCIHDQYPPDPSVGGPPSRRYSFTYDKGIRQKDNNGSMIIGEQELIVSEYYTYGVNSMGVGVLRMVGQGATQLIQLMEQGATTTSLDYVQSNAIFATMTCYRPEIVEVGSMGSPEPLITLSADNVLLSNQILTVVRDASSTELGSRVQAAINVVSNEMGLAQKLRNGPLLHKPSVALSKSFQYAGQLDLDTLAGGMDRHPNVSANTLENLLHAAFDMEMLTQETTGTHELRDGFIERNQAPTIYTTETDAEVAANVFRTMYRNGTDYDPDGTIVRGAHAGDTTRITTESWATSFGVPIGKRDGDCDDVNFLAVIMGSVGISPVGDSMYKGGGFVSPYPDYDPKKHRVTTALRNALFNHSVALSIVSANAASGSDIKKGAASGKTGLAGHAVLLLLDKVRGVIAPIARGISRSDLPTQTDPEGINRYTNTFYPEELLEILPAEEQRVIRTILANPENARNSIGHNAYVIDGTVTTKVSTRDTPGELALENARTKITDSMGPIIAHRISDVGHSFYVAAVEGTFPGVQTSIAPTYVFANNDNKWGQAGVTMQDIHDNQYALVPLLRDNAHVRSALNTISAFAKSRVLAPMSPDIVTFQPIFQTNFNLSMNYVNAFKLELDQKQEALGDNYDVSHAVMQEFRLTPRHLIMGPKYVKVSLDSMLKVAVTGDVDVHPLLGVAQFPDGENALNAIVISLACRPY